MVALMRSFRKVRLSLAAVGTVVALAALAPGAQADFDSGHDETCEDGGVRDILGRGASFQRSAQLAWGAESVLINPGGPLAQGFGYDVAACDEFRLPADPEDPEPDFGVDYHPAGSGAGRAALGANGNAATRDNTVDFGAADEAPTQAQIDEGNEGPVEVAGVRNDPDDAELHTIPVATSSIVVAVRLPDGCQVAFGADRQLTYQQIEGAFRGGTDFDTWGELFGTSITGAGCADKQLKRVVRLDSSGTTFAFKRYLQEAAEEVGSGQTWSEPTLANQAWPNNDTNPVERGAANGNGPLLDKLSQQTVNGGIGYADLGTGRSKGYDWIDGDDTDTSFWVYAQRIADGEFRSPASEDDGDVVGGAKGSNCEGVTYDDTSLVGTQLPASTKDSWFNVDAVLTPADYPICALTYTLAWEDPCTAVGSDADVNQDRARTAKDYLSYLVSTAGQAKLEADDYQALPSTEGANVLAESVEATGALNWSTSSWNSSCMPPM
jgi:ABC-type phosphate transport system substrate-binding protein